MNVCFSLLVDMIGSEELERALSTTTAKDNLDPGEIVAGEQALRALARGHS